MTLITITIIALILIIGGYIFFWNMTGNSIKMTKIFLPITILCSICLLFMVSETRNSVVYRKIEKVKIFVNQADQKYCFQHNGRTISLLDACSNQYPDKIPSSRVRSIPQVTVYERTYIPVFGIYYKDKEFVYVHGHDARIDQNVELK